MAGAIATRCRLFVAEPDAARSHLVRMQTFKPLDGAVLIDKPSGPTSHDIVDEIRARFRLKKVGHCGTHN